VITTYHRWSTVCLDGYRVRINPLDQQPEYFTPFRPSQIGLVSVSHVILVGYQKYLVFLL
jgi:hypothetical protein